MKSLKRTAIKYLFYTGVSIFLIWNAPAVIYSVPLVGFGMAGIALVLVLYVPVSIVIRILYSNVVADIIREEYPNTEFGWLDCLKVPVVSRSQIRKRIQLHKEDPTAFPNLIEVLEMDREI